jgi:hypothetical protein
MIAIKIKQHIWLGMKKYVVEYIARFMKLYQVKDEHQHPTHLLKPLLILDKKWEVVTMDFITRLITTSRHHDSIMVAVDKLSKEIHFIPIKSTHKIDDIARIFMREIFKFHGLPREIVSNKNTKFTSNFWKCIFVVFGTQLNFSIANHT